MQSMLIAYAEKQDIEDGQQIRIDSTVVETNIHYPTDSTLLSHGVRVITRWLIQGKELQPQPAYLLADPRLVMNKRLLTIQHTSTKAMQQAAYRDMLQYAAKVFGYAEEAIPELAAFKSDRVEDYFRAVHLAEKLARAIDLFKRMMDQTERRVFRNEKVPASEKIVSLLETHTNIIVKKRRETEFGHKIFLSGGRSSLVLDGLIERGNPADSDQFLDILQRHLTAYRRLPRQTSVDGGFSSKKKLHEAIELQVKDVAFAKKRGLSVPEMVKSTWVYKKLRNFRAGIESTISTLKRSHGLTRCTWTGWGGFKRYVLSSIVAYNLHVLARIELAKAQT